ncbi:MAG: hypothetical protein ABI333_06625 [bacterium]
MTRTTTWISSTAALAFLLAAGCGGRTLYGGGDGGTGLNNNSNLNYNSNSNYNSNYNTGGECQTAGDCRIARKWDACCSCPKVASAEDLAADPCLIPMEQSSIPPGCMVECPAVECPPCPDAGRTVDCRLGECAWKEGHCTEDTQCVAAIRVDNCCQQAFPATHADIAADPCLMYWPHWWDEIPTQCWDQWPEWCDLVDCAPSPPASRAMVCGSEDSCDYIEECATVNECTLLTDHRQCCSCPEVWPASMVGHDPCIVPIGSTVPMDCRPQTCDQVLCDACGPAPQLDCLPEGICIGMYWDGQN